MMLKPQVTIGELERKGAILKIQDGNHGDKHPVAADYTPTGIPFLMASDIKDGVVDLIGCKFITKRQADSLRIGFSRSGDVLLTHKGTVGSVAVLPHIEDYVMLTPQVTYYRVDENQLSNRYLRYAFSAPDFQARLKGVSAQSTRPYIGITAQRNLEITWVERPIQDRIVSILSAYDDLIQNNTRRIKILEEMAQMIYREWFVNFRLPGHQKVKMVESELGLTPATWSVETLESVCSRVTDGSHVSPKTVESKHLMASSKDMHRWGLDLSTCRTIAIDDFDTLVRNDCRPLAGDVLITKDGANYLKFCFAVEKDMDVVLLSSIAMLRPNPLRACSHFLAFYLTDSSVKTRLAGRVSGAAIPRIVLTDFRHFRILVPPITIQKEFVRLIGPIVALCWRLIDKNTNLRKTRDFLLPKLISGEVPVEAAAELVEQTA